MSPRGNQDVYIAIYLLSIDDIYKYDIYHVCVLTRARLLNESAGPPPCVLKKANFGIPTCSYFPSYILPSAEERERMSFSSSAFTRSCRYQNGIVYGIRKESILRKGHAIVLQSCEQCRWARQYRDD